MDNAYSKLYSIMRSAPSDGQQATPIHIRLGKVLSASPLKVDVGGTTQEAGRFYVSRRLLDGYQEPITIRGSASGRLAAAFDGTCNLQGNLSVTGGTLSIAEAVSGQARGEISVSGSGTGQGQGIWTVSSGTIALEQATMTNDGSALPVGELVLLLTEDDQTFFLLDKVVHL